MTTPTAPTTATDGPAPIPSVADHPLVEAAQTVLYRLLGERDRLDREIQDLHNAAAEAAEEQQSRAERLVRGATLAEVRLRPSDTVLARLQVDRRNVREAVSLAERELHDARTKAASELARQVFPRYKQVVRAAAAAWLEWVKAAHQLEELNDQLGELRGRSGCESPLPGCGVGDPASMDAYSATVIRDLLTGGFLDERADAAMLAGLAVLPPPRPQPVPEARPAKPKKTYRQAIKELVGEGWGW